MAKTRVYDLDLTAGSRWTLLCRYLLPPDELGVRAPGIPAGWVARAQFRNHPNQATPLITLEPVVDYGAGEFTLELTAAQTRTLPSLGYWAVAIEAPDDSDGIELARGKVNVAAEGVTP
jgi:hypothetical protein